MQNLSSIHKLCIKDSQHLLQVDYANISLMQIWFKVKNDNSTIQGQSRQGFCLNLFQALTSEIPLKTQSTPSLDDQIPNSSIEVIGIPHLLLLLAR